LPQKGKTNGTMRSCLRINTGHSSQGKGNTVTAVNVRRVVKKKSVVFPFVSSSFL
jgi:hypothetical protein